MQGFSGKVSSNRGMDSHYSVAIHNSGDVKQEFHSTQQPAMTLSPVNPQPMEGLQGTGPPPFLMKTYDMVEDPMTNGIVSWSSTNNSFIVWNSHQFSLDLLPRYFKHNNFSSFVRQLNTYGFRKVDPDRWEFANEGFLRGQKHLLKHIHRRKPPSQAQQQQQQGIGACIEVGQFGMEGDIERLRRDKNVLMVEVVKLRQQQQSSKSQLQVIGQRLHAIEQRQQQMMTFLARAMQNPTFLAQLVQHNENSAKRLASAKKKRRRLPRQEQQAAEAEGNESSSDCHEIVKYNSSNILSSDSTIKSEEIFMQNSKCLHSMLFSAMENGYAAGQGNQAAHSNCTGASTVQKNSPDRESRSPNIVAETERAAPDNELDHPLGGSPFENAFSLETALRESDKFALGQSGTANKTQVHPQPEDLDFRTGNDVFWEELLNEEFDSQEDSETEVDGDFPDHDKGEDSSLSDNNFLWDKATDSTGLTEQMGKMEHITSRLKQFKK